MVLIKFHLLIFCLFTGNGIQKQNMTVEQKLEKKFGQSSVFVASTLQENGGTLKGATPSSLLKEAIHVISCGYEDKTDWGKEVLHLIFDIFLVYSQDTFLIFYAFFHAADWVDLWFCY